VRSCNCSLVSLVQLAILSYSDQSWTFGWLAILKFGIHYLVIVLLGHSV